LATKIESFRVGAQIGGESVEQRRKYATSFDEIFETNTFVW
jgi:hypothetical protein